MADKTIKCKDCGNEFIFSEAEQAFYREKDLKTIPYVAPIAEKRAKRNAITVTNAMRTEPNAIKKQTGGCKCNRRFSFSKSNIHRNLTRFSEESIPENIWIRSSEARRSTRDSWNPE